MPRKYKNTDAANDFNMKVMDAFVTIQDKQMLSNGELVRISGINYHLSGIRNITGLPRSNYRGPRERIPVRDSVNLVTLFDLCRGLNENNPEKVIIRILATAMGYQEADIAAFLSKEKKDYELNYK
jgi:hypothetical protein